MGKRDREEEEEDAELVEAVQELAAATERSLPVLKLRALDRVMGLLDPADDLYAAHRALVEDDASYYLVQLVGDESEAVSVKAAETIAALAAHSAAALLSFSLIGPVSERLNPVQQELVEQGAIAALAPLALSGQEAKASAATLALSRLCSYNQEAKLAYLEQLVSAAAAGRVQALGPLETLVGGMECSGEEAARMLEQLQQPVMQALRAGSPTVRQDSLVLLGTLLEKRPDMGGAFQEEGALPLLASFVITGSPEEQDLAVHCLWLLAKEDKAALGPGGEALGCDVGRLARCLVNLVKASEEEEREKDLQERQGGGGYDPDSETDDRGAPQHGQQQQQLDICYADEASLLLGELAGRHEGVAVLLDAHELVPARKASCCVM